MVARPRRSPPAIIRFKGDTGGWAGTTLNWSHVRAIARPVACSG